MKATISPKRRTQAAKAALLSLVVIVFALGDCTHATASPPIGPATLDTIQAQALQPLQDDIWGKFDNNGNPVAEPKKEELKPPTPEEILKRGEIPVNLPARLDMSISQILTDEQSFPSVKLYVSALDEKGVPVKTIKPESFKITEEDMDAGAVTFADPLSRAPLAVCFVVDTSMSMELALGLEKLALKTFIDRLGPNDEAALISFSDIPTIEYYFTNEKDRLKDAVDALSLVGQTAIWDAIRQGMEMLLPEDGYRRALVVLTDGQDNMSKETMNSALSYYQSEAASKNKGFTIYTLGLGNDVAQGQLEEVAKQTGGRFLLSPTPGDLDRVYRDILSQIENEYVLEYKSPHTNAKGKTVKVRVDVDYYGVKGFAEGFYRIPGLGQALGRLLWPGIILTAIMAVILAIVTYLKITRAAWLTVMITPLEGKDYTISGIAAIGRTEDNEVMLRHDPAVQDHHAVLKETSDGYVVEALSRDYPIGVGTEWVRRVTLRDRDAFWVGTTMVIFREKTLRTGERHPVEAEYADAPSLESAGAVFGETALPTRLTITNGTHAGQSFPLTVGRKIYIGRQKSATAPDGSGAITIEIVLDGDSRISRLHAVVRRDEYSCWAADMGSTNGTYIDGVRVKVESPLPAGAILQVGDTILRAE